MPQMGIKINQDYKASFGAKLRRIRESKGISQETLAAIAGLDRTYVSSCERGKRNIGLENIHRLANALEITVESLFKDDSEDGK